MQLNLCDLSACPRVWPCVSVYRVWELQDVIVSFCVCVFQPWEACRVSEEIPKALCKALQMRPAGRFLHLQKPQTPSTACCRPRAPMMPVILRAWAPALRTLAHNTNNACLHPSSSPPLALSDWSTTTDVCQRRHFLSKNCVGERGVN